MNDKTKRIKFTVELDFTSTNSQPIHVKEWWALQHITGCISSHIPQMHKSIQQVSIQLQTVEITND